MKLIIDIPDETKNNISFYGLFLNPRDKENLVNAIKNGKPLNDELQEIRQEIEEWEKMRV